MATIQCFEELEIWKLAREQAKDIFQLIQTTALKSDFALREQLSKSSCSVMDNIAEGFERSSQKEFIHFLFIAKGSNAEVRSQLYSTADRGYLNESDLKEKLHNSSLLSKKIHSLIQYLKKLPLPTRTN